MQYILSLFTNWLAIFGLNYPTYTDVVEYVANPVEVQWEVEYNIDPEIWCLAEAVYFEAKGEPVEGKIAVGKVILNRVKAKGFPNTVCEVVNQPSNNPDRPAACQFSYVCGSKKPEIKEFDKWEESVEVAANLYYGLIDINIKAKHYVRCGVRRVWMERMYVSRKIGNHCFMRQINGKS